MKREDGALLKTLDCMDAIPEPIGTYLRRVEKEYHLWDFYWTLDIKKARLKNNRAFLARNEQT